jgi:hypothetical protein
MLSFLEDWQFWQLVVAAIAALLGFFGGTLATHSLDRKRDQERERAAAASLATALHAEISAIRAKAGQLFGLIGPELRRRGGSVRSRARTRHPQGTVFDSVRPAGETR